MVDCGPAAAALDLRVKNTIKQRRSSFIFDESHVQTTTVQHWWYQIISKKTTVIKLQSIFWRSCLCAKTQSSLKKKKTIREIKSRARTTDRADYSAGKNAKLHVITSNQFRLSITDHVSIVGNNQILIKNLFPIQCVLENNNNKNYNVAFQLSHVSNNKDYTLHPSPIFLLKGKHNLLSSFTRVTHISCLEKQIICALATRT